jgi:hypothetical protein
MVKFQKKESKKAAKELKKAQGVKGNYYLKNMENQMQC